MKIIFKIAKNELRYLFYSPIAWFIIIVFLVECAVYYTTPIYDVANWQDIMFQNNPKFKNLGLALTVVIFIKKGLLSNVISNLYLFIPVLTMGVLSREVNNGSVKLLYSSPVRLRQIVLGKYLGLMLYNILLVAILGFFMIVGAFNINHVDYGMLWAAILGFYLLVCAYSAIGLFMSALSTYQVVSALSTFVVIFFLSNIGSWWQRYDFVRDLTWFLSLQNRTWKMLTGLIVSRDFVYFIIVSAMFVAFTMIKLRAGREAKPWYIKAGRYVVALAIALAIGYTTSRPTLTGYWDTTASKFNTIPKEMQNLIKETGDSTLEVTLYTNLLSDGLEHCLPEARNADYLTEMWEPYQRFKPDLKLKYVYYYDNDAALDDSAMYKMLGPDQTLKQIAAQTADDLDFNPSFFKSPEEIRKIIDLKTEDYRPVMQLKYGGKTEFLRTYKPPNPFWPSLGNVSAAFKRLLHPSKIPKIYFVTGELERNIHKTGEREYAGHTIYKSNPEALVNNGYNVDTVNLTLQDIPSDTWALVLADPKMELNTTVGTKLKSYIAAGGNLLITGEPGKQYVINPVLKQLGVQLMNGQLVQPTYDETPDKVIPYGAPAFSGLSRQMSEMMKSLVPLEDSIRILMPGATGIDYTADSGFTIKPVLLTVPDKTWIKVGELVIDSTLPPINPAAGDLKRPSFPTSIMLTRKVSTKEQRIIVCSDADFANNMRGLVNSIFVMPSYSWLTNNEFPVYMTEIPRKDLLLNISAAGASVQKITFVWVLPGLVLLTGVILLIRRKRK